MLFARFGMSFSCGNSKRLGEQFRNSERSLLVNQMLGMGIEMSALESMDPAAAYGSGGGTVRDRVNTLKADNAEMSKLVRESVPLQDQMTAQETRHVRCHPMARIPNSSGSPSTDRCSVVPKNFKINDCNFS